MEWTDRQIINSSAAANKFNVKLSPQGSDNEFGPVIQKDTIDHHKSSPIQPEWSNDEQVTNVQYREMLLLFAVEHSFIFIQEWAAPAKLLVILHMSMYQMLQMLFITLYNSVSVLEMKKLKKNFVLR